MKKALYLSVLLFFAVLMVLPASISFNSNVSKPTIADGGPLPPPIPPNVTLMADGGPLPPPIPPNVTLMADGGPLPPPIPPNVTLMADGGPLPPPIPPDVPANSATLALV